MTTHNPAWRATLLTLFPEMFPGPLGHSLAGTALEKGEWALDTVNIRDFATDKHATVDDKPFGGGAGMVMRPDVVGAAVESVKDRCSRILITSPRGKKLDQPMVESLVQEPHIAIICGRYEGIDQRVIDAYGVEEFSIGDFVLSGGEIAALTLIDACVRRLPGVLGNSETYEEESFASGGYEYLLEYPHYTRPAEWNGHKVPEILLSGNHEAIKRWRFEQVLDITQRRRGDLWEKYQRSQDEKTSSDE